MSRDDYLDGMPPAEIAIHFKEICPEFGDLDVEELLVQQESAFSYLQYNRQPGDFNSVLGETSDRSVLLGREIETSHEVSDVDSQLALDEALARSLEELGDDFYSIHISGPGGTSVENIGSTSRETPTTGVGQITRQDDIDPDNMTYEELQSLGDAVGTDSKGLPADMISRLPTFKHKAGSFFKKNKKEKEECVICCAEFKNGVQLTALPCAHHYHSDCITRWLELKKHCPVCQKEVDGLLRW